VAIQAIQVALLRDDPSVAGPIIDGREYHFEASRIASGAPAPAMPHFQSPLFPWALSAFYRVLGTAPANGLLLQAALVLAIAWLVLAIARRILDPRPALAAGIAASLYGPLLFFASQLIPAPVDAVTVLAVVYGSIVVGGSGGIAGHCLLGLACGVALAARGTVAPAVAWLALRPWRALPPAGAAVRSAALAGGTLAGLAPVAVSNWLRSGSLSLATSNLGVNLWVGNNPDIAATTGIRPGWQWDLLMSEPARHGAIGPLAASDWLRDRALDWIASDPLGFLRGLAVKTADVFNGFEIPRNLDPYGELGRTPLTAGLLWDHGLRFPFGLVLPLAGVGAAVLWRGEGDRPRAVRSIALFVLLNAVGIALFFPCGRYRLGLALAILPLAVAGVVAVAGAVRRAGSVPWPALAVGGALAMAANLLPPFTGPDMRQEGPYQVALAYETAGRHADAARLMEDEVARRPDAADAWRLLGQAKDALGDRDGAIVALRRTVELAPEYAHAWQHLGSILWAEGRPAEAVPVLEKAVAINPGHPLAWIDLAASRIDLKDHEGALAAAREAVRVNPGHGLGWLYLGHALARTGNPAAAEEPLRRAAALMPDDPRPRYQLARTFADRGMADAARAEARAVLSRWPGHKGSKKLIERLSGSGAAGPEEN
jgi:cytochrome c-type biogenesis protein CcmH/NrfG